MNKMEICGEGTVEKQATTISEEKEFMHRSCIQH